MIGQAVLKGTKKQHSGQMSQNTQNSMHSKVCYRKICLCHCFMVMAQTHVQAVATVH